MDNTKADNAGVAVVVDDEIEALRLGEELHYASNRAALGKPSLDLIQRYLDLYKKLWQVATDAMPVNPIGSANLFTHQMLMECRADLIRTMLLLMRTHLVEAHAQTRRAIESCAWARRVHQEPSLVTEWLNIGMDTPPSRRWKENVGSKLLFPEGHPHLVALRERYQITSRCVHPFRFSFQDPIAIQHNEGGNVSIYYSFFDPENVRLYIPTRFLWTLQTHELIFNVFEECSLVRLPLVQTGRSAGSLLRTNSIRSVKCGSKSQRTPHSGSSNLKPKAHNVLYVTSICLATE